MYKSLSDLGSPVFQSIAKQRVSLGLESLDQTTNEQIKSPVFQSIAKQRQSLGLDQITNEKIKSPVFQSILNQRVSLGLDQNTNEQIKSPVFQSIAKQRQSLGLDQNTNEGITPITRKKSRHRKTLSQIIQDRELEEPNDVSPNTTDRNNNEKILTPIKPGGKNKFTPFELDINVSNKKLLSPLSKHQETTIPFSIKPTSLLPRAEMKNVIDLIRFIGHYGSKQYQLLETYSRIYDIIVTRRSAPFIMGHREQPCDGYKLEEAYHDLKTQLKHCIFFSKATVELILERINALKTVDSYLIINRDTINVVKTFLNSVSESTESKKNYLINELKRVIKMELKWSAFFFGYQSVIMETLAEQKRLSKPEANTVEAGYIQRLHRTWFTWLNIIPLLLIDDNMMSDLSVDYFLDIMDGIHLYYWQTYYDIYKRKATMANGPYKLMADTVASLGFPGPPRLYREGIVNHNFSLENGHSRPFYFAKKMYDSYRRFFELDIYRNIISKCCREVQNQISDLYFNIRVSLCEYLNWFFGKEKLRSKTVEALNGNLGLHFAKCLDILRRARNLATASQRQIMISEELEILCVKKVPKLLEELVNFKDMFYLARDWSIRQLIVKYYERLILVINRDYAYFAVKAAKIMTLLGYEFAELPSTLKIDFKALSDKIDTFIDIVESAVKSTLDPIVNQITMVKNVDYIINKYIRDFEMKLLRLINGLKENLNPLDEESKEDHLSFRSVWLRMPLRQEVRELAEPVTKIQGSAGWCVKGIKYKGNYEVTVAKLFTKNAADPNNDFLGSKVFGEILMEGHYLDIQNPYRL